MNSTNAVFSFLLDRLPIISRFLLQFVHLFIQLPVRLSGLLPSEVHEDFRVVRRLQPLAKGELRAAPQNVRELGRHLAAVIFHLKEDLVPDARHLLEHVQLLARDDVDRALIRCTLDVERVVRVAIDPVLKAREAPLGKHAEAQGLHRGLLVDQVVVHQRRLRDGMRQLRVLDLLGDPEFALVHDDDQVLLDGVALLDQHLVDAWFVLLEEAGDLHGSVPRHALEVRERAHDLEHLFLLLTTQSNLHWRLSVFLCFLFSIWLKISSFYTLLLLAVKHP